MEKAVNSKGKILQVVIRLVAAATLLITLILEINDFGIGKFNGSSARDLNVNERLNRTLLINDPPDNSYVVIRASPDDVRSDGLVSKLATLVSNKLISQNINNADKYKDLTKFIPYLLGNEANIDVNNDQTVAAYLKLLTSLLEGYEIMHIYPFNYNKTTLAKLISMRMCDILQQNNVDVFKSISPFVKFSGKYEKNGNYSVDLIRLAVKAAVYEYIERISAIVKNVYSIWWKEKVSNVVARVFLEIMENDLVSEKSLGSFGEELEVTLTSLGQFIILDINQDSKLSPNEIVNVLFIPNAETIFPFISSLFRNTSMSYGITISMVDFIILHFSSRITDNVTDAHLCNIVRL